jgi:nucleoside-diphosphate-sugar epimerase
MASFTDTQFGAESISLSGRRVLVTGGRGFLGSHTCAQLFREGAEVYATSRSAAPNGNHGVQWLQGDFSDLETVRRVFARVQPEIVFHFAGHVSATPAIEAVRTTLDSLLVSAVNVLVVAAEGDTKRVILPGSLVEPAREEIDFTPTSPYVVAKWAVSTYGRLFQSLYRTPVVIVRPAYAYGPGQPEGRIIPYVINRFLAHETPKLTNGRFEADWVYVDDVVEGLLAAARTSNADGKTIDLGTGTLATVREVVQLIIELMGASQAEFGALPDRPGDRTRAADVVAAKNYIGWSASTDLRHGLQRTIDWFASHASIAIDTPR